MKYLYIFIALLLLIVPVVAIPTTNPATMVGNNNFTFNGAGYTIGDDGWFQWSMRSGQTWAHTPNETADADGIITYTLVGSPVYGCTTYFYRACDSTGCGSEETFMTLEVTVLPTTTFGRWAENITANGFDPGNVFWNAMQPYMNVSGPTIFYGLVFGMIFIGVWLRTRGTAIGTIFGMICVGLFASSAIGLQLGLPPEFLAVGQAVLYISLAGSVVAFTFK